MADARSPFTAAASPLVALVARRAARSRRQRRSIATPTPTAASSTPIAPPPAAPRTCSRSGSAPTTSRPAQLPLAAQQAAERFPVTLYTFDCGEVCQNAEALLNRRGVPFTTVNVHRRATTRQAEGADRRAARAGAAGRRQRVAKGYLEARWQAMLDEAGYPKTPAAAPQIHAAHRREAPPPVAATAGRRPPRPRQGHRLPEVRPAPARLRPRGRTRGVAAIPVLSSLRHRVKNRASCARVSHAP